MEILKKHYEKIILVVILLGLALAAAALPFTLEGDRQRLAEIDGELPPANLYTNADISAAESVFTRIKNPPKASLTGGHNTFNPVVWKQKPNGELVKLPPGSEGPEALKILAIRPLNYEISYDKSPAGGGHYFVFVNEAEPRKSQRRIPRFVLPGQKAGDLVLAEVKGAGSESAEFVFEDPETKERIVVTTAKSYSKVVGYACDLRYDLENKTFDDIRQGEEIGFAGGRYKIVVIDPGQVKLVSTSTQKQTTLYHKGSVSPQ